MTGNTVVEGPRLGSDASKSDVSAGAGKIRLMVVDAHPLVRWALTQLADAQSDLATVAEAADSADAVNLAFALAPDVVTIDCSLSDGQGWALARTLRDRYPKMGIVILTADSSDELLFRALDCGASAFVAKSAPILEVVGAIRHAAVAASAFSAAGLAAALRRRHTASDRMVLSPRERQILFLLRDGMSVPEIAASIYVSLSTAKTYVARLYEKLGARNRSQALMTAVRLALFDNADLAVVAS